MSVLHKKDHTHPDPRVRMVAVEKIADVDELVEVACTDESPRVRLTAVARIDDDRFLEKVARNAEWLDVRLVAVERIFSQGIVADLLKSPENLELIGMCFSRITDKRIIESIAQDPEYSAAVRRMAVEYFADESFLADVSGEEEAKLERKSESAVECLRRGLRRWAARGAGDRQVQEEREGAACPRDHRAQGGRDRGAGG